MKGDKPDEGLRKEVATLGQAVQKLAAMKLPQASPANDGLAEVKAGLARLEKIARAPTKWVYDATGEIVGGKKDI